MFKTLIFKISVKINKNTNLQISLIFSPVNWYHVSSEKIFKDFAFNGFTFSFPSGSISCLFEREPQILPSVTSLHFHPSKDLHRVSSRANHEFCLQRLYTLHFPNGFLSCLFEREPRILPSVVFRFHPQWIPCLLRENFHRFYP